MGTAKKKIIMFQLPFQEFRNIKMWSNTPWGAGLLKATALREGVADFFDMEILPPSFVDSAGDALLIDHLAAEKPDILCATLYLWNSHRSLHVAGQLKKRLPNLLFIAGGPEISADNLSIVNNPVVDYGCIGEGEEVFVAILRAIAAGGDPPPMAGLFLNRGGHTTVTPGMASVADLGRVPSPLQMGIIKPVNEPIVTYETMRGCPCTCSYCVTGTQLWRAFPADRVVADLELLHRQRVKKVRLSCSNFLLHPEFFEICDRLSRINADRSMALVCFSYAEHVTREKAEALKSCNFFLLEIGLQTVSAKTLQIIRRPPFDESRFLEGLAYLRGAGLKFSIDLIAGLPEESAEDIDNAIAFVKRNGISQYNVFPLQLLPGSPLRREAAVYGIEANPQPPYRVMKTRSLSRTELRSYEAMTECDHGEICFDLAREFRLPRFADLKSSEGTVSAANAAPAPVTKILIPGAVDAQRFMETEAGRIGSTVIMIFSGLDQSLASCAGIIEAVWQRNPFSLIMPVFEVTASEQLAGVARLCTSLDGPNLVRKTVVKSAELLQTGDYDGFTFFDTRYIGGISDLAKVGADSSPNILVDLSPHLGVDDLWTVLSHLVSTGKNIQYKNVAFHYLDHVVRQRQAGQVSAIHAPVDMGRIVTVDGDGGLHHLSLNSRMAVEIAHMQLLFMRSIQTSGADGRNT